MIVQIGKVGHSFKCHKEYETETGVSHFETCTGGKPTQCTPACGKWYRCMEEPKPMRFCPHCGEKL